MNMCTSGLFIEIQDTFLRELTHLHLLECYVLHILTVGNQIETVVVVEQQILDGDGLNGLEPTTRSTNFVPRRGRVHQIQDGERQVNDRRRKAHQNLSKKIDTSLHLLLIVSIIGGIVYNTKGV